MATSEGGEGEHLAGLHDMRKRRRCDRERDLRIDPPPPPFAAAREALAASYAAGPAPRTLRHGNAQPIVSLVCVAAARLTARDFRGAAALMPVLLRRFRRQRRSKWSFPREVTVLGAEILRRTDAVTNTQELENFLMLIVRDRELSSAHENTPEASCDRARDAALLELAVELIAAGRMRDALEALRAEAPLQPFASSPLVHAYIGILSIALSAEEEDPTMLLGSAISSLITAAKLDPVAHCFIHYAAAAAITAGDNNRAITLQRDFVRDNPDDPLAISGLLSTLNLLLPKDCHNERITLARTLVRIDPISTTAQQTIREAHSWTWNIDVPVDRVEVADVLATKIECGAGDESTWGDLLTLLRQATEVDMSRFMFSSGRSSWWSSSFFKPVRAAQDAVACPAVAMAKKEIAEIIYGRCEYARTIHSILGRSAVDDDVQTVDDNIDCDK